MCITDQISTKVLMTRQLRVRVVALFRGLSASRFKLVLLVAVLT